MAQKKYSDMSIEELKDVDIKKHAGASRARAEIKSNVDKYVKNHKANKAKWKKTQKRVADAKKKVQSKENWVHRLKRGVQKVLHGDKKKESKSSETTRTKAVKKQLSKSLDEKEIKKLQGK